MEPDSASEQQIDVYNCEVLCFLKVYLGEQVRPVRDCTHRS